MSSDLSWQGVKEAAGGEFMDNGRSETLMVDCGHFPTKLAATEAPSSLRPPNDGPRTRRRPLWVVSPMGSQRVNEDIRWGGSGSCSSGFRTQAPESYTDGSQAPALRTAMPPFHSGYPGPGSPPSLILGGSKVATSGLQGGEGKSYSHDTHSSNASLQRTPQDNTGANQHGAPGHPKDETEA